MKHFIFDCVFFRGDSIDKQLGVMTWIAFAGLIISCQMILESLIQFP